MFSNIDRNLSHAAIATQVSERDPNNMGARGNGTRP
jgi:hypothetical protein